MYLSCNPLSSNVFVVPRSATYLQCSKKMSNFDCSKNARRGLLKGDNDRSQAAFPFLFSSYHSVLPSSFFLSFSCLNTPSSSATIVSKLKSFIVPRGRHVFLKNTQFVTSMDNGSSNNNFLKHLARIIRCIPSRYVELKYFPFSRSTPCKIKWWRL